MYMHVVTDTIDKNRECALSDRRIRADGGLHELGGKCGPESNKIFPQLKFLDRGKVERLTKSWRHQERLKQR